MPEEIVISIYYMDGNLARDIEDRKRNELKKLWSLMRDYK